MTDKIKLSEIEAVATFHYVANDLDSWRQLCDWIFFNHQSLIAMTKAVMAAKEVIDFVNPMFCDTDECLVKLRESLSPFDWSKDDK